ncbi:DUF3043 domain-containing protein [Solihabitans fulvus]|uniref:DUF3043 domain-containing protein n=1 Tax=Solihabitans fulvus TaxID=1892852 RepID=A0A5B2WQS5_9PSEU|nr:DUF3043 domain-containing protein [Solihabitans fulvus]KAA2253012.1 DUF3043 domain-containing protein [Solihabitans fulvus]
MRFLRRNATESTDTAKTDAVGAVTDEADDTAKAHTAGKGRPTPKRREAEARRRGPVPPPPRTQREALRRTRGNKASKDERRQASAERRQRMMAGDDRYLLPRDRGPVKAYVRDLVDSRRNLMGLFMPLAILVFVALLTPVQAIQTYSTLFTTLLLVVMIIEGVIIGRRNTTLVRAKFPKETVRGLSIGWYSFIRASQVRKLRVPKPRLRPGQQVT